jgi:hypothetical protein
MAIPFLNFLLPRQDRSPNPGTNSHGKKRDYEISSESIGTGGSGHVVKARWKKTGKHGRSSEGYQKGFGPGSEGVFGDSQRVCACLRLENQSDAGSKAIRVYQRVCKDWNAREHM